MNQIDNNQEQVVKYDHVNYDYDLYFTSYNKFSYFIFTF